jgi:hypothetical protein
MLTQIRESLSKDIFRHFGGVVAYGPLKGTRILERVTWGGAEGAGSKILGLYESSILEKISTLPSHIDTVVDIGAADGYYAVGMLRNGIVKRAICFELDPRSQKEIDATAQLNNVRNQVEILGLADFSFLQQIQIRDYSSVLFIVDVEGNEYELLTNENLEAMKMSHMILELHEFNPRAIELAEALISRAEKRFSVEILHQITKNQSDTFFDSLSDHERGLVASEGRPSKMRWLYLTPQSE